MTSTAPAQPIRTPPKPIVIAGGTGFLGQLLARLFQDRGIPVIILSRNSTESTRRVQKVQWDGATLGSWADCLEGAAGLINLAGRSVNCRYNALNRKKILDSRIHSTRVLGSAVARCRQPPSTWLNASTATIYKHSFDRPMDEAYGEIGATAEAKDEFSVQVAEAWERTFDETLVPGTRKVTMRTAMVLGQGINSVFPVLCRLVRWGLGGQMGDGRQFVSWIHEVDFCRAIEWLLARENFDGIVNIAAPNPIPNARMMSVVRSEYGRRFGLSASRWMLEAGAFLIRTETELVIKSRRVVPGRLLDAGFSFKFPDFQDAVRNLLERDEGNLRG